MAKSGEHFRDQLEAMTRAELIALAKKLKASKYSSLNKDQLINKLLVESAALKRHFSRRLWRLHDRHIYGIAGILLAMGGIFATVIYSKNNSSDSVFEALRREEVNQIYLDFISQESIILNTESDTRQSIDVIPEYEYSAFDLLGESHTWDLRPWRDLEPLDYGKKLSPSTLTSEIKVKKKSPADFYPIYAYTGGLDLHSVCESHNFTVYAAQDRISVGDSIVRPRLLKIDVSEEPLNKPFTIRTQRTYFNGLLDPQNTWVGTTVRQENLKISFLLIFPEDRPFIDYELLVSKVGSEKLTAYKGKELVFEGANNSYIFWEIVDPKPQYVYKIKWIW